MTAIEDPLVDPAPAEVPLRDAPLVRVIAQVRFPLVMAIERRDFVAPFQEAVRAKYSVLRPEQTRGVMIGPGGPSPAQSQVTWRFSDVAGQWRVSLAPDFLALETTAYSSRADFVARWREVVDALSRHVGPQVTDRLGVRYIDRLHGSALSDVGRLVRSEMSGIAGTKAATHVLHAVAETLFAVGDSQLLARWGRLPAGATADPSAIEPTSDASWILDLDMFRARTAPFDVDRLAEETRAFAERIYTFFRWAVTPEFLKRFGGASR
jgi:uncharacterized protein (TIGR04255 family)